MRSALSLYEFSPVDWHLADTIAAHSPGSSDELKLAVALLSKRCREGHVCVSLPEVADLSLSRTELDIPGPSLTDVWPSRQTWLKKLRESDAVTEPDRLNPAKPVVLWGDRLYLSRYYFHERALAQRIRERVAEPLHIQDPAVLRVSIEQHYSPLHPDSSKQRVAIAIALLSRLCIVTGGPGTGKTSTIIRLLGVLVGHALREGCAVPRVLLLAPTGKAASRIAESIRQSRARLLTDEPIRKNIPESAITIHRALGVGSRWDNSGNNKLAADVVVVDEASMVDLALMRRLFDACENVPRLILLGDPEQLESVLAGSVLAELSGTAHPGYSLPRAEQLHALTGLEIPTNGQVSTGLDDCRIELTGSHRFQSEGGIGKISELVRGGFGSEAWRLLTTSNGELRFVEFSSNLRTSLNRILELAKAGYGAFFAAKEPQAALCALNEFRILSGHRNGPFGVTSINEALSNLAPLMHCKADGCAWPCLITENATELSLYNGDVGVLYAEAVSREGRRAYFLGKEGQLRAISSSRLPAHELAFAMTVHKSQGSELENVVTILPRTSSPLLTRELLYTAITRARSSCTVCGTKEAFIQACQQKSRRSSGLREALAPIALPSKLR